MAKDNTLVETNIVTNLEEAYPNRLPYKEVSPFELGRLIGHQEVVNHIKERLRYEEIKNMKEK